MSKKFPPAAAQGRAPGSVPFSWREPRTWRHSTAFLLYWVSFLSTAFFYPGGGQNEAARYDTIRSVLHEGQFTIDRFVYNSADVIKLGEHYYSSKAPGTFFLAFPSFAFFDFVLRALPIDEPLRWHWVCYLSSVFSITLLSAICAPLIYWYLRRLKFDSFSASLTALVLMFGTILWPFASVFFSHATVAATAFLAFYQIFAFCDETASGHDSASQKWRLWLAGFALGFSITFEYPAAILVLLIGLYAIGKFARREPRAIVTLVVGGLLGLAPLFLNNILAFQNPFYIPYEAYATDPSATFEAHKHGVLGIRIPFLEPGYWPLFFGNLAEITYRPLRGLFFCNPVLLLIFPGFYLLWSDRKLRFTPEVILFTLATLGYFAFNASYGDSIVYWGGGASFGPRHLTILIPFLALPIATAIRREVFRPAFIFLACVSVFFCLLAIAIEPRAPYEPNNVIFGWYLPKYLTARLSFTQIGIFSNQFITANSVAFNWGYLAGLPAKWQLVPLFAFWIFAARELDRQHQIVRRGLMFATALLTAILLLLPWAVLY